MGNIPRILLADDNPDDQSFIRDALLYVNPNLVLKIEDNGFDLLEHLKLTTDESLPHLIVLDYNMPKMSGVEVLQELLKVDRYRNIPKIILSTSVYQVHIDHCLDIGADGYLFKPDNLFSWKKIALNMLAFIKEPGITEQA